IPRPDPDAILGELLLLFVAGHGTLFLLCTGLAISQLRAMCLEPGHPALPAPLPRATLVDSWDPVELLPAPLPQAILVDSRAPVEGRPVYPVQSCHPSMPAREPALLWKEVRHALFVEGSDPGPVEALRRHWRGVLGLALCGSLLAALVFSPFGPGWAEWS